jgi:hypothetical protein
MGFELMQRRCDNSLPAQPSAADARTSAIKYTYLRKCLGTYLWRELKSTTLVEIDHLLRSFLALWWLSDAPPNLGGRWRLGVAARQL